MKKVKKKKSQAVMMREEAERRIRYIKEEKEDRWFEILGLIASSCDCSDQEVFDYQIKAMSWNISDCLTPVEFFNNGRELSDWLVLAGKIEEEEMEACCEKILQEEKLRGDFLCF